MIKDQWLEENYQKMNDEHSKLLFNQECASNNPDKEIKWIQANPFQKVIHNDTTLIVSNNKSLKFYSMFSSNRQVRILNMNKGKFRKDSVCYFFHKSKEFITLGIDGNVRIWHQNEQSIWVPKKRILYIDYCRINVVVVNSQENKIITGGFNKISFWDKQLDWKCSTTIKLQYDQVVCLSLSENEERLISVGYQYEISVFHKIENMGWQLLQRINEQRGYLLSFIINDLFVFKTNDEEFLTFYEFNYNSKIFIKQKQIQIPKENKNLSFIYSTNQSLKYHFVIFSIGDQTQFSINCDKEQFNNPSILFKSTSFNRISGLKQKIYLKWFKGKDFVGLQNQVIKKYFD